MIKKWRPFGTCFRLWKLLRTPRQYVLDKLNEGLDVVLEIDPQGALQVKKSYPDGVFVFIVPPSLDELSKRIYKRGLMRLMSSSADSAQRHRN